MQLRLGRASAQVRGAHPDATVKPTDAQPDFREPEQIQGRLCINDAVCLPKAATDKNMSCLALCCANGFGWILGATVPNLVYRSLLI